jgi:hypothetical protein
LESRRIRLLTTAFHNGWLDFKKRFKWDKSKEDIILWYTEQKLIAEVYALKTIKESIVATLIKDLKFADQAFTDHLRFKLPSIVKESKLNKGKEISEKDKMDLVKLHRGILKANKVNASR